MYIPSMRPTCTALLLVDGFPFVGAVCVQKQTDAQCVLPAQLDHASGRTVLVASAAPSALA